MTAALLSAILMPPEERREYELWRAADEKARRAKLGYIPCELLINGRPMSAEEEQMFQEAGHPVYRKTDTKAAAASMVKLIRSLGWDARYRVM